ncbi:hypothetical protein ID0007_05380 [Helicobacter pylori]
MFLFINLLVGLIRYNQLTYILNHFIKGFCNGKQRTPRESERYFAWFLGDAFTLDGKEGGLNMEKLCEVIKKEKPIMNVLLMGATGYWSG